MKSWEQIIRAANDAWLRANGLAEQSPESAMTGAGTLDPHRRLFRYPEAGSPLYERLRRPVEGCCAECGHMTEERDEENDDFCHHACRIDVARGQARDHAADDPRHGQAREINAKFWDIP